MRKFLAISTLLLFPALVFASCNPGGYTIIYINGINTTNEEAEKDTRALGSAFEDSSDLNNVKFFNAHNQTRGQDTDLNEAAAQLVFSRENVFDAIDFRNILQQIQSRLETQKVLLVGHSQGSLYANEVYDYLIGHGVSKDSVAVYNIATPANRVGGQTDKTKGYLTSSTDKVINKIRDEAAMARNNTVAVSTYDVGKSAVAAFIYPLAANITIPLDVKQETNLYGGHDFFDVYLKEAGSRIVADMERELVSLKDDGVSHSGTCFEVSDNSLSYLAARGISTFASFTASVANALKNTAAAVLSGVAQIASDVIGGTNGLAHSAEPEYESTNFNVANHIFGAQNQQVDGENLYDLLHEGTPSQGGAVVLATLQDADESAPDLAQTPTTPDTPTVPIGPTPGVSPGGGGGGSAPASDPAPQAQAAATASAADTTAPVISGAADVSIETADRAATSSVVTYTLPTATDDVDGEVAVSCDPVSGNDFVVGTTTVTCSTSDTAGNTAQAQFGVGVHLPPLPPPDAVPVVINEVAWGGGFGAPTNQWVELYNNSSDSVSLSDVTLTTSDGAFYVPLSGTIAASSYYIVASNSSVIRGLSSGGWSYTADAALSIATPAQLVLVRSNSSGTTTLDKTPAVAACGSWCAGSASATSGFAASSGSAPMPVTMERISVSASGEDASNWAGSDGYVYVANDAAQQRIVGTPNRANSSHWPMVGFVCTGDSAVLTPGSSYTHRPASNSCHYLSGYSNYSWSPEALLLKGVVGSSTIVTKLSASSGPNKDLQTNASNNYDFASAQSGDTYTIVFFEFNNNVGGSYNAYYLGDMEKYVQTGFRNDGVTDTAPYEYQTVTFVIP